MPPPSPGIQIGRYSLVRQLGAGGMGEVWEAMLEGPQGFRKPVALKLLRQRRPGSPLEREALLQEARLGALLHHPNVVGVHALEEHDQSWIVVMELVRGASVSELLSEGPLPARAVVELGVQAAAGLAHIHALRVDGRPAHLVHRDIKPANLLVDETGLLKVADLGVAATAGAGPVVGTPSFMAPEQGRGQAEARSDLFSLGVTLYVCALKQYPYGTRVPYQLDRERVEAMVLDPEQLRPVDDVVPGLGNVLRRCLQPDPAARFASATELAEALALLRSGLPPGPMLRDLLASARPDLALPPASPAALSPPASSASTSSQPTVVLSRGNLPPRRDAFFGRSEEVQALVAALRDQTRLLSVVGPGGMGKTRLALQAGSVLQRELTGGGWFFDLSEAVSVEGICVAMASALRLKLDRTDPVAQIGWALSSHRSALFVVDNVEQCVQLLPQTLGRWADFAHEGRFLVTSRVVPGLRGEQVVRLGPLPTEDAAKLFLGRAPVQVPEAHLPDVHALVDAVEGLPLAVELAAARAGLMSVPQLREHLGLRLLSGGSRERPERHRSLQASLEWSWELLPEHGRAAMAQLSVFDGGFDLWAADAVLQLPDDSRWALDVLHELVDASLVRVDPGRERFSMLVAVQAFAAEGATERGADEQRHGAWFAQQRDTAVPGDLANLVVACRRAVARQDGAVAAGCALGAWHLLKARGSVALGAELLDVALACPGHDEDGALAAALIRAMALGGRITDGLSRGEAALSEVRRRQDRRSEGIVLGALGVLHNAGGDKAEAERCYGLALAVHRQLGDRPSEGRVLSNLGILCQQQGRRADALAYAEAALAVHRATGSRADQGVVLGNLGILCVIEGRLSEGRDHLMAALESQREAGDRRSEALILGNLGNLYLVEGRMEDALASYEAALVVHREVGNRRSQGLVLGNIGNVHQARGRLGPALEAYEASLRAHRELGDRAFEGIALSNLGSLLHELGRTDEARRHLHDALGTLRGVQSRRHEAMALEAFGRLERDGGALDAGREHLLQAATIARDYADPVLLGVVLTGLGDLERRAEALQRARTVLDEARTALRDVASPEPMVSLLCEVALLELDEGNPDAASTTLAEAEALADRLAVPPGSRLGRRLRIAGTECAR